MITFSIIQKSQLEGAQRLDAEYYQPEYLKTSNILNRFKSRTLSDLCKVSDGNHLSISEYFSDSGVRYLRGQDLTDFFISETDPIYVPEKIYEKLGRSHIHQNDVLVSIVGTVGMISIVAKSFDRLTGNCKIAILHSKQINPWFLAVFLMGKYGQNQIQRKVMGAVQQGIILKDLSQVSVPMLDDKKQLPIEEMVKSAYKQETRSYALYSQAEALLLRELGLTDFEEEDDLFSIVNLSEVQAAHRMDAEYFDPKFKKILDHIKVPFSPLSELTIFLSHSKQPPYIENGDVPILTQKYLGQVFIEQSALYDNETKKTNKEWLKQHPQYQLKAGDILYYSVGAYIGKTNILLENLNATAASFITIIRPKKGVNPFYLTVLLNSVVGKTQSERWQSASAQQYIYPKDIQKFRIPLLPTSLQEQIASLVRQSHEARKESKRLLEKAKRKVEEMIENQSKER